MTLTEFILWGMLLFFPLAILAGVLRTLYSIDKTLRILIKRVKR